MNIYMGLGYQSLQKDNRIKREKLPKTDQDWLKNNGYRNIGWPHVISLFDKIQSLQELTEYSLEELFLEVDRIGERYQEPEEIQSFQAAMADEAEQIAVLIDQIFPDTKSEVINFGSNLNPKKWRKSNQRKTYYTSKF
jgi:hypothetical protein